jgi:hypothetical protein
VVQTLNPINETTSGLELNQPRNSFFKKKHGMGRVLKYEEVVLELKTKGSFKEILLQSENQTTLVSRFQKEPLFLVSNLF